MKGIAVSGEFLPGKDIRTSCITEMLSDEDLRRQVAYLLPL
jgi:hypothetical protein